MRIFQGLLCNESFYKCVVDLHTIKNPADFEKYATDHPENNNGNILYYLITAEKLKTEIENTTNYPNCYDYHVIFELEKGITETSPGIAVPSRLEFDKDKSCYSIPLLKGIMAKLEEDGEDLSKINFQFCNAVINGKDKIIFKVKGTAVATSYFDLTVNPTLRLGVF